MEVFQKSFSAETFQECVAAFLKEKIKFTEMSRLIERAMQSVDYRLKPTLDNLFDTDKQTRRMVEGWI